MRGLGCARAGCGEGQERGQAGCLAAVHGAQPPLPNCRPRAAGRPPGLPPAAARPLAATGSWCRSATPGCWRCWRSATRCRRSWAGWQKQSSSTGAPAAPAVVACCARLLRPPVCLRPPPCCARLRRPPPRSRLLATRCRWPCPPALLPACAQVRAAAARVAHDATAAPAGAALDRRRHLCAATCAAWAAGAEWRWGAAWGGQALAGRVAHWRQPLLTVSLFCHSPPCLPSPPLRLPCPLQADTAFPGFRSAFNFDPGGRLRLPPAGSRLPAHGSCALGPLLCPCPGRLLLAFRSRPHCSTARRRHPCGDAGGAAAGVAPAARHRRRLRH